jgi:hypothetical protein
VLRRGSRAAVTSDGLVLEPAHNAVSSRRLIRLGKVHAIHEECALSFVGSTK